MIAGARSFRVRDTGPDTPREDRKPPGSQACLLLKMGSAELNGKLTPTTCMQICSPVGSGSVRNSLNIFQDGSAGDVAPPASYDGHDHDTQEAPPRSRPAWEAHRRHRHGADRGPGERRQER